MKIESAEGIDALDFAKGGGLVAVVTQHAHTGEVLMVAWADREALRRTLAESRMWYYSRSRAALWRKGETSGNGQRLVALHGDCDGDTVLALVLPEGPSCHTGERTCFGGASPALSALDHVIGARASTARDDAAPAVESSYTRRLLADENLRLKKLGEEAVELALACARDDRRSATAEAADLVYHALVACRAAGVTLEDVLAELARRAATSSADAPG